MVLVKQEVGVVAGTSLRPGVWVLGNLGFRFLFFFCAVIDVMDYVS